MKKIIYTLIIIIALSSCSSNKNNDDIKKTSTSTKVTTTTSVKSNKNTLTMGETATTRSGSKMTVIKLEDPAIMSYGAGLGKRYIAFEIETCRGDEKTSNTSSSVYGFELKLNDSTRVSGSTGRAPELNESRYEPGECIKGWVTFEIPDDAKPDQVLFTYIDIISNDEVTLRWQVS